MQHDHMAECLREVFYLAPKDGESMAEWTSRVMETFAKCHHKVGGVQGALRALTLLALGLWDLPSPIWSVRGSKGHRDSQDTWRPEAQHCVIPSVRSCFSDFRASGRLTKPRSSTGAMLVDDEPWTEDDMMPAEVPGSSHDAVVFEDVEAFLGEQEFSWRRPTVVKKKFVAETTLGAFYRLLAEANPSLPSLKKESNLFRFGNGQEELSEKAVSLPIGIHGRLGGVEAAAIKGDAPLRLSRSTMKSLGAVMDFAKETLSIQDDPAQPLTTNAAGQFVIDVMNFAAFAEVLMSSSASEDDCGPLERFTMKENRCLMAQARAWDKISWQSWAGALVEVMLDPARTNLALSFVDRLELTGSRVLSTAAEARNQLGKVEKHGHLFEVILQKVLDAVQPTCQAEFEQRILATRNSKNEMINNRGLSPVQHVFGRNPRIPNALLQDEPDPVAATSPFFDAQAARTLAILIAARTAVAVSQDDISLRTALNAKPRVERDFIAGDFASYWRTQKCMKGVRWVGGRWYGTGIVKGEVGRNVLVFDRQNMFKVSPEHLRHASDTERAVAQSDGRELLGIKDLVADGQNLLGYQYVDLTRQEGPPNPADVAKSFNNVVESSDVWKQEGDVSIRVHNRLRVGKFMPDVDKQVHPCLAGKQLSDWRLTRIRDSNFQLRDKPWPTDRGVPGVAPSSLVQAQAFATASGMAAWSLLLLAECIEGPFRLEEPLDVLKCKPPIGITDCRSLYGHLIPLGSGGTLDEKRAAIDVAIIRQGIIRCGLEPRWCATGHMLAEGLTKDRGEPLDLLCSVVRSAKYQLADEDTVLERAKAERDRRKSLGVLPSCHMNNSMSSLRICRIQSQCLGMRILMLYKCIGGSVEAMCNTISKLPKVAAFKLSFEELVQDPHNHGEYLMWILKHGADRGGRLEDLHLYLKAIKYYDTTHARSSDQLFPGTQEVREKKFGKA
eukprot:s2210_g3.t1